MKENITINEQINRYITVNDKKKLNNHLHAKTQGPQVHYSANAGKYSEQISK